MAETWTHLQGQRKHHPHQQTNEIAIRDICQPFVTHVFNQFIIRSRLVTTALSGSLAPGGGGGDPP